LDWIGVQDGTCYATDRYSIGIAVFREHPGLLAPFHLPLSEAKDMVRWLKPVKVNQRKDSIRAEVHGLELHRMRLYPTGYAAVVTVGNNFLGAVSQLKDIPGYGDRSLLDWGIG
jgi:hypothetical protein